MKAWMGFGILAFLALPGATAQAPDLSAQVEQIHLAWDRQEYWVTFLHPLVLDPARTPIPATYTTEDGKVHEADWFRGPNAVAGMQVYHFPMEPNATLYTIGSRTFDIEPAPGPGEPVRVAFLADIGQTADTRAVLDRIRETNVSMVLMGGDLSYANGDEERWNAWFRLIEPLASIVPVQPARGNHEARCVPKAGVNDMDCSTDERIYRQRFFPEEDLLFYGFEWGPARFYSLDTEAYFPRTPLRPAEVVYNIDSDEQRSFVADRLLGNERAWEIVFFHRPAFSSNGAHGSELAVREHLVATLEQGGADLVLSGHDHDYERTWALREGKVVARTNETDKGAGVIYVVSGGGGDSLYPAWDPVPDWSAKRTSEFEFLLLDISHAALRVQAIRPDGSVLDSFLIERTEDGEDVAGDATRAAAAPGGAVVAIAVGLLTWLRRHRG